MPPPLVPTVVGSDSVDFEYDAGTCVVQERPSLLNVDSLDDNLSITVSTIWSEAA